MKQTNGGHVEYFCTFVMWEQCPHKGMTKKQQQTQVCNTKESGMFFPMLMIDVLRSSIISQMPITYHCQTELSMGQQLSPKTKTL